MTIPPNARTDLFLNSCQEKHESLLPEAIERAHAYAEAGADGFFVPGLVQKRLIKHIVQAISLPVNVMMMGELQSVSDMADLGVSRVSFGPKPYFDAISDFTTRFEALCR